MSTVAPPVVEVRAARAASFRLSEPARNDAANTRTFNWVEVSTAPSYHAPRSERREVVADRAHDPRIVDLAEVRDEQRAAKIERAVLEPGAERHAELAVGVAGRAEPGVGRRVADRDAELAGDVHAVGSTADAVLHA